MLRRRSRPAARRLAPLLVAAFVSLTLSACTLAPHNVTSTAATLSGVVWPSGKPTTYWFEYGTTTSYGQTTPTKSVGPTAGGVGVSERVTGLSPGTSYHVRLCQDNSEGRKCHADVAFTTKQPGFQEEVALEGLELPTAVRFAADGRVFVAEKRGIVKVFDSLGDPTPATFADLRTKVFNNSDRGLLGLALDPSFPSRPYVYVAYHHDALPGGSAPRYGSPGADSDPCPDAGQSCPSDGRVSRLTAAGNQMTAEKVLVDDYCFQYDSHSVGHLAFGPGGALYASAGDGSSYWFADYGQVGNPCGDPPGPPGADLNAPGAEGGSLRSQDLRTPADPAGLNGAIIRIHPDTGEALTDNPLAASPDPNARRIVAYGLRNPYRFALRPGTGEVWTGDVGWGEWEEVNRIANPTGAPVENLGWPCYQGGARDPGYESAGLDLCLGLYGAPGAALAPTYAYRHADAVVAGEGCGSGSSAIAGLAFKPTGVGNYPSAYDGALFFSDYARGCIWAVKAGAGGLPDPARIETFQQASYPVDLVFGPGGDLFYSSIATGTIRRIRYFTGNTPPSADAQATPTYGAPPLNVTFDATGSSDRDEEPLSYAWDLDDDGQFDDSTAARPARTFTQAGSHRVTLQVTDGSAASDTDSITISVGNTPPNVTLEDPSPSQTWRVGQRLDFAGSAFDTQDGVLPASAYDWEVNLQHCHAADDCHAHFLQTFQNVAAGSFLAPDHEYPSYLELKVTATDSGGLSDSESVRLEPRTVTLRFETTPSGLELALNAESAAAPFTRTVIEGSMNSISAPTPQTLLGLSWAFESWSDGGDASHNLTANAGATYRAQFEQQP